MKWTYKNFVIYILNTKEICNKSTSSRSPRIQTLSAGIMHTARSSSGISNNSSTSLLSKASTVPRDPAKPPANKHSWQHALPPYARTEPPFHHTSGSSVHRPQQTPVLPHRPLRILGQAQHYSVCKKILIKNS